MSAKSEWKAGPKRPFVVGKQTASENFAASFLPKTLIGIWIRNQVTRLMRLPKVAELLIGGSMTDDFELPDYGV